jgi:flagellin-specific chaperone FliS
MKKDYGTRKYNTDYGVLTRKEIDDSIIENIVMSFECYGGLIQDTAEEDEFIENTQWQPSKQFIKRVDNIIKMLKEKKQPPYDDSDECYNSVQRRYDWKKLGIKR